MDENKFWLSLWTVLATFVFLIASLMTFNSYKDIEALQEMVAKGTDPIAARCALGIRDTSLHICVEVAKKGK